VLLEGGMRGIATIKKARASSMVDPGTISLIKGSGMHAADPTREVPQDVRWYMAGPPVAVGATRILVDEIRRYQADGHQIDWLIPHQANLTRILIPACKSAGIDPKRLCASFAETGNTSSASIPLLLDQLAKDGRAKRGENALMIGFGASFAIGSALLTFN
jgi:3-oxoacyl-[acyl-carrier-protein] synthase III